MTASRRRPARQPQPAPNSPPGLRLLTLLRTWAAVVLALHALSYALPPPLLETRLWSLWPYANLPLPLGLFLLIACAALLVPRWNQATRRFLGRVWANLPTRLAGRGGAILLSLIAMALFWGFRLGHLQWGDAAILVNGLSFRAAPVIYNWQAPFTVFLHQRLWHYLADPLFGASVADVYALVSVVAGGGFVLVLLGVAKTLGRTSAERLGVVGLVGTVGSVQLFFGYVENYSLISLGLLIFLGLGLRVVAGQAPLWSASLALAVTNAFHPSTVILWPAVLYLLWLTTQSRPSDLRLKRLLDVVLPPAVVATSVLSLMSLGNHGLRAFLGDDRPGGGDHVWFVPLFEITTDYQHYTMFSLGHLLDWLNLQFLVSGVAVGGLLLLAGWRWRTGRAWFRRGERVAFERAVFLGVASLGYTLLTWVWNADYGIRKDWDLFSPPAFAYTLLFAFLLPRALSDEDEFSEASLFLIGVAAVHLVGWVYTNWAGWG